MNIKYLGILEKYIDTYYYSTMLKNSSFGDAQCVAV